jgi:molecular chaperone HscB
MISEMVVDFETPDAERLEHVREQVRKMQFLNKLHAEAEAVEAALEDEAY